MFSYWPPAVTAAVGAALDVGAGPAVDVVTVFTVGEADAILAVGDAAGALVDVCDAAGWGCVISTDDGGCWVAADVVPVVYMEIKLAYERLSLERNILFINIRRLECSSAVVCWYSLWENI